MGEYRLNQSASGRAWGDTKHSFHTIKFFLGVEVVSMGAFIFLATLLIPENASRLASAGYPAVGAIIGAIVGFGIIYLVMLAIAPYKQRNEARALLRAKPKPIPLQNRNELRGAIASVENATIQLVNQQHALDIATAQSAYTVNTKFVASRDKAYAVWNEAMNELRRQYLIAGDRYESVCVELTGFIWSQIAIRMGQVKLPPEEKPAVKYDIMKFVGVLGGKGKRGTPQD